MTAAPLPPESSIARRYGAARVTLAIAAVLFSTGGAAIKMSVLTSWQVACLRSGIATLVLAVAWPLGRTGWTRRTLVVAITYATCVVSFVSATKLTTAANAIYIQSTAPLYILLVAPLVLRERIRRHDYVIVALIAAGLLAFFISADAPQASAPNPLLGNGLAVISGLSYAGMLIGFRWMQKPGPGHADAATVIVAGNLLAALVCVPLAWPLPAMGTVDWSVVGFLGIVQIGIAYVLVTRGVKHVPAFEASLILLLEPALNPVWTWLTLGEVPSRLAICGGLLILSATVAKSWLEARAPTTT
ncbi:MAG: DMT family transporter [Myxococcota bacterium]